MKKIIICLFKTTIVVVLFSTAVMSCKKKEVTVSERIEIQSAATKNQTDHNEISIATLKQFMSGMTNIPVDSIKYNDKNEQFVWRGKDQISKADLLFAFKQHNGGGDK